MCEVPALATLGREIAAQRDAAALHFTDVLDAKAVHADVWLSSGAIHYIEDGHPARLVQEAGRRPLHLLLNKLPLYDGDDFVCAQNVGDDTYVPHYVYNREGFIARLESAGYAAIDAWSVPERRFHLPGHPKRSFKAYSGLYLRLREPPPRLPQAMPSNPSSVNGSSIGTA